MTPIDLDTPCIEFEGYIGKSGYAFCAYNGGWTTAHRVAYMKAYGDESVVGLDVDHVCENRSCINVLHLQAITHRENLAKSNSPSSINARKTHCIHGHEFTPENTGTKKPNKRYCRECQRQRLRALYRRKKRRVD